MNGERFHPVLTALRVPLAPLALLATLLASPAAAQAVRVVDIAREPLSRLDVGMTSAHIRINGIRLGMYWDEARAILDRERIDYLYSKGIPTKVYIAPARSTYYFVLNPSSYQIVEMGVMGAALLPLDNSPMADGRRWRLTSARTWFFRGEGDYVRNEEGENVVYDRLGFVLKWLTSGEFRFVMVLREPPPPPPPPSLTLYGVRFFVTGYYFPNTTQELERLLQRRRDMAGALYIDFNDPTNANHTADVDALMRKAVSYLDECARYCVRTGRPLSITITGFYDPRGLTRGSYIDPSVTAGGRTILIGSILEGQDGNERLALLRAYWTSTVLDRMLVASSDAWRTLSKSGAIRWSYRNGGEGKDGSEHANKRAIEITPHF
jgi:hypothetical protein